MWKNHLRTLWAWVNQRTVAPWVIIAFTTVYGFARWEATVSAQAVKVAEIEVTTEKRLAELREQVVRDQAQLRTDLIDRLDDIKKQQSKIDDKLDENRKDLDKLKEHVRGVSSDMYVVCIRVSGHCVLR